MLDFSLAVIGPTAVRGLGLADGCLQCAKDNPAAAQQCHGFGPGCLGARETASATPAKKR